MNKAVQILSKEQIAISSQMTTEEIVNFIENFKSLVTDSKPKKSKLISMKVPEDLLQSFKSKAKLKGKPYQTLIKQLMKEYLY